MMGIHMRFLSLPTSLSVFVAEHFSYDQATFEYLSFDKQNGWPSVAG